MKAVKYLLFLSTLLLLFFLFVAPSARAEEDKPDTLTSENTLSPPTFSLSPLSFTYDAKPYILKVENLFHEFEMKGFYTYSWYKNGVLLGGSADNITIKNVSDSGEYQVSVTFTYEGMSVTAHSPLVRVEVLPMKIAVPEVPPGIYDGSTLCANIKQSPYYTIEENEGGTDVGTYPLTLKLKDKENTVWEMTGQSEALSLSFEILKARNEWIEEGYVIDTYLGTPPTFGGYAKFGTPYVSYSEDKDGPFSLVMPGSAGKVYARVNVDGTNNYTSLISEVFEIEVRQNAPVAIRIDAPPDKTVYTAFDEVNLTGIRVSITHLDGSVTIADIRSLRVLYDTYPSYLSASDSGVTVAYGDFKARLPLTIRRATYSLDELLFENTSLEYSGDYLTINPVGKAPTGKDGIPLKMQLSGGGTDCGTYTVTLTFSTESSNYDCPTPRQAILTILPKTVSLTWEMLTFVYDGMEKTPKASFVNVYGTVEYVEIEGAKTDAGKDYLATAKRHGNYVFDNATSLFSIEKGEYDMSGVSWSGESFVFDGGEKTPVLIGLPQGVSVSSYHGNRAISVGEYTATATLLYDAKNYNAPNAPLLTWHITKATYDLSSFEILGGLFVYDGKPHTPTIAGTLPVGIDGHRLQVSFSDTVTNVSEGKKEIVATFSTTSGNYETPFPITVSIAITPAPLFVEWQNTTFTYDGEAHRPMATYKDFVILVEGEMVRAGEYVAIASIENSNYYITNPKCAYVIQKAKNEWILPLTIKDAYTSKNPTPVASAKYGDVIFTYFDVTGNEVKNPKDRAGKYTCIATVRESDNYTFLTSSAVRFTVYEVIAIETVATLIRTDLFAFDKLSKEDFTVKVHFNDGTGKEVTDFRIEYENATSLRAKDSLVYIVTDKERLEVPLAVRKATFTASMVDFSFTNIPYNKDGNTLEVLSLPEGVTLLSLSENTFTRVGKYTIIATFSLDEENYEGDGKITHTVTIEKAYIPTPALPELIYSGVAQRPEIASGDFYDVTFIEEGKNAGEYRITLTLKDTENTAFADTDNETLTLFYTIKKAPLTVTLSDITIYRDGTKSEFSYYISKGTLHPGDTLRVTPMIDQTVHADITHENYEIETIAGRIIYSDRNAPIKNENTLWLMVLGIVMIFLLLLFLLYWRTGRKNILKEKTPPTPPEEPKPPQTPTSPQAPTPPEEPTPPQTTEPAESSATSEILPSSDTEEQEDEPAPATESSFDLHSEGGEESLLAPVSETPADCHSEGGEESLLVPESESSTPIPLSPIDEEEEYVSIFDVFPTVEYETEDEPQSIETTSSAPETSSQAFDDLSHPTTAIATIAPMETAPAPTRSRKKKKRKKRAKKASVLERFFEFIFAPWHRDASRHAERTVAHATQEQSEGAYTQPDTEGRDFFGITEEEADRLLSDRSAEALLEYRNAPIVTYGKRRAIINIDTLSKYFSSGERVDIEILKARSLIPYDTLHIKVLARGSINKPLYVFANDFSLCAIKMLLLSGGKAVKQKTKSTPFAIGAKGKGRKS